MDKKKDSEKMINRWKKQLASLLKLEQGHSDDEGINELISELQNKIKSLKNEK